MALSLQDEAVRLSETKIVCFLCLKRFLQIVVEQVVFFDYIHYIDKQT